MDVTIFPQFWNKVDLRKGGKGSSELDSFVREKIGDSTALKSMVQQEVKYCFRIEECRARIFSEIVFLSGKVDKDNSISPKSAWKYYKKEAVSRIAGQNPSVDFSTGIAQWIDELALNSRFLRKLGKGLNVGQKTSEEKREFLLKKMPNLSSDTIEEVIEKLPGGSQLSEGQWNEIEDVIKQHPNQVEKILAPLRSVLTEKLKNKYASWVRERILMYFTQPGLTKKGVEASLNRFNLNIYGQSLEEEQQKLQAVAQIEKFVDLELRIDRDVFPFLGCIDLDSLTFVDCKKIVSILYQNKYAFSQLKVKADRPEGLPGDILKRCLGTAQEFRTTVSGLAYLQTQMFTFPRCQYLELKGPANQLLSIKPMKVPYLSFQMGAGGVSVPALKKLDGMATRTLTLRHAEFELDQIESFLKTRSQKKNGPKLKLVFRSRNEKNLQKRFAPYAATFICVSPKQDADSWKTIVRNALRCGNVALVNRLLDSEKVDPSANESEMLRVASRYGRIKIVKRLLKDKRVNPAASENEAVRLAAQFGHTTVIEVLLEDKRVNPSARKNAALRLASRYGHINAVKKLLADKRVDPSANYCEAAQRALWNGHQEVQKLLVGQQQSTDSLPGSSSKLGASLRLISRLLSKVSNREIIVFGGLDKLLSGR